MFLKCQQKKKQNLLVHDFLELILVLSFAQNKNNLENVFFIFHFSLKCNVDVIKIQIIYLISC